MELQWRRRRGSEDASSDHGDDGQVLGGEAGESQSENETLRSELEALTTQVKELEAAVEAEEESVGDGAGGEE